MFHLQGLQVHHSVHFSQGLQALQERCPQMKKLQIPGALGGQEALEALEAPDNTSQYIMSVTKWK